MKTFFRRIWSWLLCCGRHDWATLRFSRGPRVGGPYTKADFCRRCGRRRDDQAVSA